MAASYISPCVKLLSISISAQRADKKKIDPYEVAQGSPDVTVLGRERTSTCRLLSFNVCKLIKSRLFCAIPARSRYRQPFLKNRSLWISVRVCWCCWSGESAYLNVEVRLFQRMSCEEKFLADGTVEVSSTRCIRSNVILGLLYFDVKSCREMGDENGAFNHRTSAWSWIELDWKKIPIDNLAIKEFITCGFLAANRRNKAPFMRFDISQHRDWEIGLLLLQAPVGA